MAKPTRLITDPQQAIERYSDRLEELLALCERALQTGDQEAFLWNARRALEALCRLLITVKENKVTRDSKDLQRDLSGLIQHLKNLNIINDPVEKQLDLARSQTNLGVHIRQPEPEDYTAAIKDVRHLLPQLVIWAMESSPDHERLFKRQILQAKAERIESFSGDSLNRAVSLGGIPAPTATTDAPTTEDSQGFTESRTTDGTGTTQVRTRARGSDTEATAVTDATDSGDAPLGLLVTDPTVPKAPSRRWGVGLGLVGAIAIAALIGVSLSPNSAPTPAEVVPPPSPAAAAVVAPPPEAAVEAVAEAELEPRIEPTPPPPAPTCPAGMTLIPASTITIGQPVGGRKNWPTPRPARIAPIEVPAFCVHNAPITFAEWDTWPRRDDEALKSDCQWGVAKADKSPSSPAHCVGRAAAVAYCADAVPGGHLPTIAEWEALARSPVPNLGQSGVQFEWAEDLFPPAVFNRRAEPCRESFCDDGMFKKTLDPKTSVSPVGDVLWSWSQRPKGQSHNELTFRCAVAPSL
ncbi:formylglycine-generating enzyme family protein [Myxococcota bacterium]|nr:formylglycine-generating enzyme family protein [Myxococcota bacterium]